MVAPLLLPLRALADRLVFAKVGRSGVHGLQAGFFRCVRRSTHPRHAEFHN
jgi:hypothetical protein